jgi:hypothetical protein
MALVLPQKTIGKALPQNTNHRHILFNCQRTDETTAKRFSSTMIGLIRPILRKSFFGPYNTLLIRRIFLQ